MQSLEATNEWVKLCNQSERKSSRIEHRNCFFFSLLVFSIANCVRVIDCQLRLVHEIAHFVFVRRRKPKHVLFACSFGHYYDCRRPTTVAVFQSIYCSIQFICNNQRALNSNHGAAAAAAAVANTILIHKCRYWLRMCFMWHRKNNENERKNRTRNE